MRFALCLTVDRHGLRPCDDKVCKISEWHRYNTIFEIARDAAIHPVSRGCGWVCLFVFCFTVDRHGLSALAMTRCTRNK